MTLLGPTGSPPGPSIRSGRRSFLPGPPTWGFVALLGTVVGAWTWRALADPHAYDLRLYYHAGQVAFSTGHPERVTTWDGTPLLAAVMALVSRLTSLRGAGQGLTVINAALAASAVGVLWSRLRPVGPGWLRNLVAAGLLAFAPLLSTVWWKQFNVIVLVAALGGYLLLRSGATRRGAFLIALSIALKPLLVLLAPVLLIRPGLRRAGGWTIAFIALLTVAGQAVLAVCAGSFGPLDPFTALDNFLAKSRSGNVWACQPVNLAPGSLLCRTFGAGYADLLHAAVLIAVLIAAAAIALRLPPRAGAGWELLAFLAPLSIMLSPLAWAHYQVVLAPLLVLLAVGFARQRAGAGWWAALALAYALCSLLWLPYGTLPDDLRHLLTGRGQPAAQTFADENGVARIAQLGQYLLLLTGALWYARGRARRARHRAHEARPAQRRATVRL